LCPPGAVPAAPGSGSSASIINPAPTAIELYDISLSSVEESFMSLPTPNPFSERASVSFAIAKDFYDAELIFTDSYGRELGRKAINSERGVIEIESSDLESGIYQYSLVVDGEIVKTNKMVVVK